MIYLIAFGLFHLLAFAFLILACTAIAGGLRERWRREHHRGRCLAAREILRRRFALGEVQEAEYREKLAVLDQE